MHCSSAWSMHWSRLGQLKEREGVQKSGVVVAMKWEMGRLGLGVELVAMVHTIS